MGSSSVLTLLATVLCALLQCAEAKFNLYITQQEMNRTLGMQIFSEKSGIFRFYNGSGLWLFAVPQRVSECA